MPLVNNYKKLELGQRMAAAQSVVDNSESTAKQNAISQLNAQKTALQNSVSNVSLTATEQTEYDALIADINTKISILNA